MPDWIVGILTLIGSNITTGVTAWLTFKAQLNKLQQERQSELEKLQQASEIALWERMKEELDRQNEIISELRTSNTALEGEVAKLRYENGNLRQSVTKLREENKALREALAKVRGQVKTIEKKTTGPLDEQNN